MTQQQTALATLARITSGDSGWVALGDFIDDWHRADAAARLRLISEAPRWPDDEELRRWAALTAASVDWLASTATPRVPIPAWVRSRQTVLAQPWFLVPGSAIRMHLLIDTPAPFSARNIFGGDHILDRV